MKLANCQMKPTGEAWLGQIPAHWDFKRLKYCVRAVTDKVDKVPGDRGYIGLESIESETGRLLEREQPLTAEGGASLFERDDVLFGKLRPYLAKAWHATIAGACTSELLVMRPKLLESRYLIYSVLNPSFIQVVDGSTYGSQMPRASWDFIGSLPHPAPSPSEQRRIAAFLDAKLGRLDDLMRKKERQLALLAEKRQVLIIHAVTRGLNPNAPTKPSGLSWLGSIPMHWQTKRVKYLVTKIGSGKTPLGGSSVYSTEGVMFLRSQNVHDDGFRLDDVVYISDAIDEVLSTSRVEPNDILLNITGASIGRVCKFPAGMPRANVNQHVCILRPHHSFAPDYVTFALQSRFTKHQIFAGETGTSREGLNFEQVGNMVVVGPFHNRQDQEAIAADLQLKLSALSSAAAKLTRQIDKLREYRQALITAAVTGQVVIPEETAKAGVPSRRPSGKRHGSA